MPSVRVLAGMTPSGVEIRRGESLLVMDTDVDQAGQTVGPVGFGPDELLLASLGACTLIALKEYAEQHDWVLSALDIDLRLDRQGTYASIERILAIAGELDENQREQFLEVAEHTPVTLVLKSGLSVRTEPA